MMAQLTVEGMKAHRHGARGGAFEGARGTTERPEKSDKEIYSLVNIRWEDAEHGGKKRKVWGQRRQNATVCLGNQS